MAARRRRSQAKKPQRQTPGWVLAGGGVLAGLAIATLLFIGGVIDSDMPLIPSDSAREEAIEPATSSAEPATPRATEFTFYEQLEQREVQINEPSPVRPRTAPEDEVATDFLVQAGSFRSHDDAEAMKAQLAFLGLSANVEAVDVQGTRWHRVVLGPYDSRREAGQIQRRLRENRYEAEIRSRRRNGG